MDHPVVYDITRLAMRVVDATPNGIDRVDLALARHFLSRRNPPSQGAIYVGALGHRLIGNGGAIELVDAIEAHFGERAFPDADALYADVKAWLRRGPHKDAVAPERLRNAPKPFLGKGISWLARHGAPLAYATAKRMARGARYINVSQYPLAIEGAFDWALARPDVKPIFFIHDMLPLEMPEYFRAGEKAAHQRRMENVARHAAGAIVSTETSKNALLNHLATLGRRHLAVLIAPLPISPIFSEEEPRDRDLPDEPYFIQCGTLEPRKNHLMILHLWRELVAKHGEAAPKLVLVGARGWKNEDVVELLERRPGLKNHVLEVSGLATPSLKRLMKGARALLMPSFGEGYGLPLAEALAVGTPAIASDIPVFQEIAGDRFTALSPIDAQGWMRTIEAFARRPPPAPAAAIPPASPDVFFRAVDEFAATV
jgi:glycosyltransferase involved in cell wall biosynthesis